MIVDHGPTHAGGNNILLPEASSNKSDRICPNCENRLFWIDHVLTCCTCGKKITEDALRPKSQLGAKWDGSIMLVQSEDPKSAEIGLPEGAQLIKDEQLN